MNDQEATFYRSKEYNLFTEFCDSCRRFRYIGLCYGPPGVGKTFSARYYSQWDKVEAYSASDMTTEELMSEMKQRIAVLYTPPVVNSPARIKEKISKERYRFNTLVSDRISIEEEEKIKQAREACNKAEEKRYADKKTYVAAEKKLEDAIYRYRMRRKSVPESMVKLIIIDEADRLKAAGLEQIREIFDEGGIGVVLIGMPGIEKRLARYPQLYSRVGFVHQFRALPKNDIISLLTEKEWHPPGVSLPKNYFTNKDALAAILQTTGGNFRTLEKLVTQIARMLEINPELDSVTPDLVTAARESLVIGTE